MKLLNQPLFLIPLLCLITLQSCFEIVEQVYLKKDGSGSFQLVVNLSQSKTRLNSIIAMKTINGHDVPSKYQIKSKIDEIEKTFSKTKGISNVKTVVDFSNFIATINCNFNKINNLNDAIKSVYEKQNSKQKGGEKTFSYDAISNIFARINKIALKDEYKKMSNADKEIFANANYTAIYKFEKDVTTVSNPDTKISPSKKATMLTLNALDVVTQKKSIENKIRLQNKLK